MKTTSRSDLKKKLTENRGNSSLEMKLEHFHEKTKNNCYDFTKYSQTKLNFCAINARLLYIQKCDFTNFFFANV